MGLTKALFGRLTMWSSKKSSSDSSSSYQPVFSVDRTEVDVTTATGVPELTLRELNKATRSFSATSVLGPGQKWHNATVVYRATVPIGTSKVTAVVKRLVRPPSGGISWSASDDEYLRQQVLVLSGLRHDNVVRLLGYTIDTTATVRVLLFEFAEMGTLHDILHATAQGQRESQQLRLSWAQRTGIALDVSRGLEYLHDAAKVSHWGICSSKVLLFQGFRTKIADYNLFKQLHGGQAVKGEEICWYHPPEYLMTGRRCSRKYDVHCYGVLLLELLTGKKRCAAIMDSLPKLMEWAAPILRKGRVEGFMDPKLGTQYPRAQALKLARIALCCVQEKPESRPSMGDVAETISCHIVSLKTSMAK